MLDRIKAILYLCLIYRAVMGEWPDLTDPDAQNAIEHALLY